MKRIFAAIIICLFITSCNNFNVTSSSYDSDKKIDILYGNSDTNLVNIKNECLKNTPNVTIVGCGNMGDNKEINYSSISKYEFKDGIDSFYSQTKGINYRYLACNLSYSGQIKDIFKNVFPYVIVDYDGIKIAYIGVTSPNIKNELNEKCLMEKESVVVNFYDEEPEVMYDTVQESINNVKENGAKYVVLLCSLGTSEKQSPYTSYELISNIYDADIVIDGNCEEVIEKELVSDANKANVILTGYNSDFSGIGLIEIEKENISIEIK